MGIMTVPAQIPLAVGLYFDSGNLAGAGRVLIMAVGTGFNIGGLLGMDAARASVMALGHIVALCTGQIGVLGYQLLIGNTSVAGAALLGRMRGPGIMGIMTGHTGLPGIVLIFQDLWKTGRTGRIISMANWTEISPFGLER